MTSASDSQQKSPLPSHIAIIMDGNGRWAEKRGLMRLMGHRAGVESVKKIVTAAREIGISVLTIYAFSTENWQRPATEVSGLMTLLQNYLNSELKEMMHNDIRLRCIGHQEKLPDDVQKILEQVILKTSKNRGMVLNLALSYGSRNEIVLAARKLARQCLEQGLDPEDITEEIFQNNLYTSGLPDPDLIIRTGGEYRLSNFLLWQASYSELYVTDTQWPNFTREHLLEAITSYQQRQRRFGRTGKQLRNE